MFECCDEAENEIARLKSRLKVAEQFMREVVDGRRTAETQEDVVDVVDAAIERVKKQ